MARKIVDAKGLEKNESRFNLLQPIWFRSIRLRDLRYLHPFVAGNCDDKEVYTQGISPL